MIGHAVPLAEEWDGLNANAILSGQFDAHVTPIQPGDGLSLV
jgi:hypothetical protein